MQVPDGWHMVRLGNVAEVNPRRPKLDVEAQALLTFIPMAAVAENCSGITSLEQREYREIASGYTYFEEDDVLFAKITPCLQNGKHALACGLIGGFGFGTTEFHVIRAGSGIDPRHLFRVLTQPFNIDKCARSFSGTAGQQRVQPETLKSLPFLLPPLPEQRAIAAVLDSIDEAIERTEAVIAATERLRDTLLQRTAHQRRPRLAHRVERRPRHRTNPRVLGDVAKLGDVATLQRGVDLPVQHRVTGTIPVYGSNGILGYHASASQCGPGVITGRSGSIGPVYYSDGPYWPLNTTLYVRDFHQNNELYIYHFLGHLGLERFAASTGVPSLNRNFVHPHLVAVPPLPEQRAIAGALDGIENVINTERMPTDKLKSLKESAAEALLTGKVRVVGKAETGL